jgi:tripartite-type tricarboxylate transporter receptor subunit TctC
LTLGRTIKGDDDVLSRLFRSAASLIAGLALAAAVQAQPYPSHPIKIIVGFAPGSGADTLGRVFGQKLSELLNTPVIIENKAGGGQILAIRTLMSAAPDGYTLYLATGSSLGQGPGLRKDLPYDPMKDFTLVAPIGTTAGAIYVSSGLPLRTVAELIAYAKANPDKLSYASAGVGSAGHLGAEYFMTVTGTRLTHIPYKSDADAAKEVAAGTVNMAFTLARFAVPLAAADKVRPLMAIDANRLEDFPTIPSATEASVKALGLAGMAPFTYYGVVGPAGMPASVVERLNAAFTKIATSPEMAIQIRKAYVAPLAGTPAEFKAFVERDIAKWRALSKTVKIEF